MPALNKNKDLEPVTDLKVAERYLRYGLEFRQIVDCYIEDANLRFEGTLENVDPKTFVLHLDLTKTCYSQLLRGGISSVDRPGGEIRLSYSVNEATLFAHTKFQGRTQQRLIVKAEMPMYKLQRRDALRFKITQNHNASVELLEKEFPLHDISATGMSILADTELQEAFKNQALFLKVKMSFLGSHVVNLELKNILPFGKDGKRVKVGFRFRALNSRIEQLIAKEAYLISSKIWSRWL